jgi:hypothetical protein
MSPTYRPCQPGSVAAKALRSRTKSTVTGWAQLRLRLRRMACQVGPSRELRGAGLAATGVAADGLRGLGGGPGHGAEDGLGELVATGLAADGGRVGAVVIWAVPPPAQAARRTVSDRAFKGRIIARVSLSNRSGRSGPWCSTGSVARWLRPA